MGPIQPEFLKLVSINGIKLYSNSNSLATEDFSYGILVFQFAYESHHNTIFSKFDSFSCTFHWIIFVTCKIKIFEKCCMILAYHLSWKSSLKGGDMAKIFYLILNYINWMIRWSISYTFLNVFISCFNHKTSKWKCFQLLFVSSGSEITRGTNNTAKMGKTWI